MSRIHFLGLIIHIFNIFIPLYLFRRNFKVKYYKYLSKISKSYILKIEKDNLGGYNEISKTLKISNFDTKKYHRKNQRK